MPDDSTGRPPSPSVAIKLAELRKDVSQLQSHDLAHTADIAALKDATKEHKMRLENGVKVFADQKERLSTVERAVTPRPPSILRIVGVTLTVVALGSGALWGLSNMLRDRPTVEQVDKILHEHDVNGHKATRDAISEIRDEQVKQRTLIDGVKTDVSRQDTKLDTILERVPAPRRHR